MDAYLLYIETEGCADYSFDAFEDVDIWEFRQGTFVGNPLPADWKLPKHTMGNPRAPLLDFIHGYFQAPFVSERAYQQLEGLLNNSAEFRYISQLNGVNYYVLNVLYLADCLDLAKSKIEYSSEDNSKVIAVDSAVFIPEKVPRVPLFKLREYPLHIYATDLFVNAVRKHRLTGVGFEDPANVGLTRINKVFPEFPFK